MEKSLSRLSPYPGMRFTLRNVHRMTLLPDSYPEKDRIRYGIWSPGLHAMMNFALQDKSFRDFTVDGDFNDERDLKELYLDKVLAYLRGDSVVGIFRCGISGWDEKEKYIAAFLSFLDNPTEESFAKEQEVLRRFMGSR